MKGKKCIGLLTLCITFLLSLNLFSNASALKKQTLYYRNINTFNWRYYDSNTITNQTAPVLRDFVTNISLNPSSNGVAYLYLPELVSNDKFQLSKNRLYHHIIIFFSNINRPETTFTSGLCPRANNTIIDKCEIKNIDRQTFIQEIQQFPDPTNVGNFYAATNINANNIYMVEIWGHGKTDNVTELNSLTYYGSWLYFAQNTSPTLDAPVTLSIYFSPVEIYEEEESAEDEAAQKELEDRDNIESQSSTTENQADNAGNAAETTGTTLFGAFSQLFTALTNVNGNSCTLPNMQVYSLNLGQMNLCTYDIPPQIMALVSIGMVFIIVPLGIHLVKRMISLYKEITG